MADTLRLFEFVSLVLRYADEGAPPFLRKLPDVDIDAWEASLRSVAHGVAEHSITLVDISNVFDVFREGRDDFNGLAAAAEGLIARRLLRLPWDDALFCFSFDRDVMAGIRVWRDDEDVLYAQEVGLADMSVGPLLSPLTLLSETHSDTSALINLAIAAMNFREADGPRAAIQSLNRATRRRMRNLAGMSFRTLDIHFMREFVARSLHHADRGANVRQHLVRGHLVFYQKPRSSDGLLGATWRNSHLRGNAAYGKVIKDYSVQVSPTNSTSREATS